MAVYLSHILPVVESDSYIDNNVFISLQMPTFQYWKSQAMINESIFILVFFSEENIYEIPSATNNSTSQKYQVSEYYRKLFKEDSIL